MALLTAIFGQLMLGVFTYMNSVSTGEQAVAGAFTTIVTVAHVAVGGLLFAFSVILGTEVWRHVLPKTAPGSARNMEAVS